MKTIFNTFLKNKWHLHSLTLPFNILFIWLMNKYNFLHLADTGTFFHIFICVFSSAAVAFIVEWIEGAFFGANKTPEQVKGSNLDMLASIIAGTVGALAAVIFPTAAMFGWSVLVAIGLLELYRVKVLNKKVVTNEKPKIEI